MSGSRWVITPSWLSGPWRSFLYSWSVYSCHLFLISSASVHTISVVYWAHLCMKYSLNISNLLEAISSIFHSVIFLYFFALITEEVSLISPFYSLELCIQMGISFLFSFAFHFFSQWFVRPPQKTILPFCISLSWGWLWSLPPVQYHKPLFIALQALCLSDLIPWIYLSVLLYNCRDFIRSSLSGLVVFPTFFNLTLNLAIRSSWRDCCFPLYFILLLRFYLVLSFGICSPITSFCQT